MADNEDAMGCFLVIAIMVIASLFTNWRTTVAWEQYLVDEGVAIRVVDERGAVRLKLIKYEEQTSGQ